MNHRMFLGVDLRKWVYGTVDKVRQGDAWGKAWTETYEAIGGCSRSCGRKSCPKEAAMILHEYGRIRDGGRPFREWTLPDLWKRSRNGTYAMLAVEQLCAEPGLSKSQLWVRIQEAVRHGTRDDPAASNQGGPTLAFQLWHQGLIMETGPCGEVLSWMP